jgi:transposase
MPYRHYPPPVPLLVGYDPFRDLPPDHLAWFVERVVEETLGPQFKPVSEGQPEYDPRLGIKVLVYAYATGTRSSRQMERLCRERLPYLFMTRGEAPSYATLCTVRRTQGALLEAVWMHLFATAKEAGIERLGRISVDSTKLRSDTSPESVLKRDEFAPVREELERILAEAEETDTREQREGAVDTRLKKAVSTEQMRDILRRVRSRLGKEKHANKATEPAFGQESQQRRAEAQEGAGEEAENASYRLSAKMLERVRRGIASIGAAEEQQRKHLSLSDPDARMMEEGRQKKIRPCHSLEVATDNGLLMAAQSTHEGNDNARLTPLVEAAKLHEPAGIGAVDADSGFYSGDAVGALLEAGVDVCIPDSSTACDLHRGQPIGTTRAKSQGSVVLVYDRDTDTYSCPEENRLLLRQERQDHGQTVRTYRAERDCSGCPLARECLTQSKAKRRTLKVSTHHPLLEAARQRFSDPEQVERYHHRAEKVEGVFGFLRATLGYGRWMLRGDERVAAEARLLKLAYQVRKVDGAWAAA